MHSGTSLHIAVNRKSINVVGTLLKNGADPSLEDNKGMQAIHIAVLSGEVNIISLLVQHGANVNALGDKMTPLYIGCRMGNITVVEVLLKLGANPEVPGKDGLYPIHLASAKDNGDMIRLLEHYPKPNPNPTLTQL